MNITTFSDYALRILIYLSQRGNQKSTTKEMADAYDISFHHVAKAAQWLAREGYVTAERGRAGGLILAKLPQDIIIGDLLKASEAHAGSPLVDCMRSDGGRCRIRSCCGLRFALAEAEAAFFDTLKRYTLEDVATTPILDTLMAKI